MSTIKICSNCGGNVFKVVLNQAAIVESVTLEEDPTGFKITQVGQKQQIGRIAVCQTCQAKDPVLVDKALSVPCPSCQSLVEQSELDANNGKCLVCAAKEQMPQLANMTQEQLIRLVIQSQAKAATAPVQTTGPSVVPGEVIPPQTSAPAVETPTMTAPVQTEAPVEAPTPEYTTEQFSALFDEFEAHLKTYDASLAGSAKASFTRKLNKFLEDLKPMYAYFESKGIVARDPEAFYTSFMSQATAAPVQAAPTVDPFTTENSDGMMIHQAHGGDEIEPLVTPVDEAPVVAPETDAAPVLPGDDIPTPPPFPGFDPSSDEPY